MAESGVELLDSIVTRLLIAQPQALSRHLQFMRATAGSAHRLIGFVAAGRFQSRLCAVSLWSSFSVIACVESVQFMVTYLTSADARVEWGIIIPFFSICGLTSAAVFGTLAAVPLFPEPSLTMTKLWLWVTAMFIAAIFATFVLGVAFSVGGVAPVKPDTGLVANGLRC